VPSAVRFPGTPEPAAARGATRSDTVTTASAVPRESITSPGGRAPRAGCGNQVMVCLPIYWEWFSGSPVHCVSEVDAPYIRREIVF